MRAAAIWFVIGLVLLAVFMVARSKAARAHGQVEQRLPFSCEQIRQFAAFRTATELEALARIYRLSREQRRMAKACLTEKK